MNSHPAFSCDVLGKILIAISALVAGAVGKTYEGFNLGAKVGLGVNNHYAFILDDLGNAFVYLTPSINLFENRLSLELDLGVSDQIFNHQNYESEYTDYFPARDTLFRTTTSWRRRYDETQFIYAYKGMLNFRSWSVFAGSMVYVVIADSEMEGERVTDFAVGDLKSYQAKSREPIRSKYIWGNGIVMPVYGVSRRFDRFSLYLQGVSMVSLQAGLGFSLNPPRKIHAHK